MKRPQRYPAPRLDVVHSSDTGRSAGVLVADGSQDLPTLSMTQDSEGANNPEWCRITVEYPGRPFAAAGALQHTHTSTAH